MDDVARDLARERLRQDLKSARPRKELAWEAIKAGTNPNYVAHRYGFTVEEMQSARAEFERREAARK